MSNQKHGNNLVFDKLESKIEYLRQNYIQKGFSLITETLKIFLIPTNTAVC